MALDVFATNVAQNIEIKEFMEQHAHGLYARLQETEDITGGKFKILSVNSAIHKDAGVFVMVAMDTHDAGGRDLQSHVVRILPVGIRIEGKFTDGGFASLLFKGEEKAVEAGDRLISEALQRNLIAPAQAGYLQRGRPLGTPRTPSG